MLSVNLLSCPFRYGQREGPCKSLLKFLLFIASSSIPLIRCGSPLHPSLHLNLRLLFDLLPTSVVKAFLVAYSSIKSPNYLNFDFLVSSVTESKSVLISSVLSKQCSIIRSSSHSCSFPFHLFGVCIKIGIWSIKLYLCTKV